MVKIQAKYFFPGALLRGCLCCCIFLLLVACSQSNNDIAELYDELPTNTYGNPQGKMTVVVFFDYFCPHCLALEAKLRQLTKHYPELRIVYRVYPVLGPHAEFTARATLAARLQGRYLALHDLLVKASPAPLTSEQVITLAHRAYLDTEQLEQDMNDPYIKQLLTHNQQLAAKWQVSGTPTLFVGQTTDLKTPPVKVTGNIAILDLSALLQQTYHG